MNIAIIYLGKNRVLESSRKIFAKELYNKGNIVKEMNGLLEFTRLTGFQYIIFFIDAGSFLGKNMLGELDQFFKNVGTINTKFVSVYTNKRFMSLNTLTKYMAKIESQGIIIHSSDVIDSIKTSEIIIRNLEPVKPGS